MPLGVWRLKVFLTSYLLPIVGGGLGLHGTWLGNSKELLGSQFVAGVWPSHYSVVWLFCSIPTVSSRPAPPTSITHLTGGHLYHIYIMLLLLLCIKLILQCNVLSIIFAKKTTIDGHSERPLQCYNEYVLYVCSMRPASGRQFASYQHNIWLVDDGGPVKNILLHYTARCCGAWRRLKLGR